MHIDMLASSSNPISICLKRISDSEQLHIDMLPPPWGQHIDMPQGETWTEDKCISICLPPQATPYRYALHLTWSVHMSISICYRLVPKAISICPLHKVGQNDFHIDMLSTAYRYALGQNEKIGILAITFSYELRLSRFKLRWIRNWIIYNFPEEKLQIWRKYLDDNGFEVI